MNRVASMRLVWPAAEYLAGYQAALERGWSPDSIRSEEATAEELAWIHSAPQEFLASRVDRAANGPPIQLKDGTTVPRLPGYIRWIWDGEFCGSIGLRWQPGTESLPPTCLGHIGYSVVPWKQGRGYATAALRETLRDAAHEGLRYVDVVTTPGNLASRRVIEKSGGVLIEVFRTTVSQGDEPAHRYRIALSSLPRDPLAIPPPV